jgi:hypothetical protein
MVPMSMVVALMPRPDPPVAVPGPQMALRLPKSPAAEVLGLAEADPVDPPVGEVFGVVDPDRPQAASASKVVAATAETTTRRGRLTWV